MSGVLGAPADVARFQLLPLAMAVEAQALRDWVERAAPGDTLAYATGAVPPRTAAAWVLARELAEARLVALTSRRTAEGWAWIAERLGLPGAALPASAPAVDMMMLRVAEEVLRCANAGEPCPTDGELAARCGLPGTDAVNYRLRKAVKARLVELQKPMQPGERRIATDPKTGKSTKRAMV